MKSKLLLLCCSFVTGTLFAQNENPITYNNAIITDNQPVSVKEYAYDYETQVEKHAQNHTFKYNSNGLLTEHIKSSDGLSQFFPQTFRYRFQYDSKSQLTYFWNEQLMGSTYKSQDEQKWVYDSYDMITEVSEWSVVNDVKTLGGDSYKRVITRDANNNILKIEKSEYSFYDEAYNLEQVYTYKYNASNILDSIILYSYNGTLEKMTLDSKQYNFDFRNYDVLNTDLLEYNSYQTSNYNGEKTNVTNTFDAEGRLITETIKYLNGELINETTWTYESDEITIADLYQKSIYFMDESGRPWKYETYTYDGDDETWQLENPAYQMNVRTFEKGKITSDLYKGYYDTETKTYKNVARYDYTYSVLPTGIVAKKSSDAVVLYPNPSSGIVYVNGVEHMQKLSIASTTGTTISLPLQEQIDLAGFAAGVYIVTAEYENQTTDIQRLIVK